MDLKKFQLTSKHKVCFAALYGSADPSYREVGRWLINHHSDQISFSRQKVHRLKLRVGGERAFNHILLRIARSQEKLSDDYITGFDTDQALSKEGVDLITYVTAVGMEIERKCEQICEAVNIWNSWSVYIGNNNEAEGDWRLVGDQPNRQRYSAKIVQRWIDHVVNKYGENDGHIHFGHYPFFWLQNKSGLTVDVFEQALQDGGYFAITSNAKSDEDFDILSYHRDHVTTVTKLSIPIKGCESITFRRHDTALNLPSHLIRQPLPRVVVFECLSLRLKIILLITRLGTSHPTLNSALMTEDRASCESLDASCLLLPCEQRAFDDKHFSGNTTLAVTNPPLSPDNQFLLEFLRILSEPNGEETAARKKRRRSDNDVVYDHQMVLPDLDEVVGRLDDQSALGEDTIWNYTNNPAWEDSIDVTSNTHWLVFSD